MRTRTAPRTPGHRSLGLLILFVVGASASCVDELPVEVTIDPEVEIDLILFSADGQELVEPIKVGQTANAELIVTVDGRRLTGLRVDWRPVDSTALSVRALTDESALPENPSLVDSLDATLFGQVTGLARGTHDFEIQIDSIAGENVVVIPVGVMVEERWQWVSAGRDHTCGVTLWNFKPDVLPIRRGGEAYCWGEGVFGALGSGRRDQLFAPTPVESGATFFDIMAGGGFTCARDALLLLRCWGDNFSGELGTGNRLDQFVPRLTALAEGFSEAVVGEDFTCVSQSLGVETTNGETMCWGANAVGQLGCGDDAFQCDPVLMTEPNTAASVTVLPDTADTAFGGLGGLSAGDQHACGIDPDDQSARCWGNNDEGQLGATTPDTFHRFAIRVQGGHQFHEVAAGSGFTCGITGADVVLCWGRVLAGAGSTEVPTLVDGLPGGLSGLVAGASHACVLADDGVGGPVPYCWGDNLHGKLGDGTEAERATAAPVSIPAGATFVQLTAGGGHTCGITGERLDVEDVPDGRGELLESGEIYCWGDNAVGALGTALDQASAEDFRLVPTLVVQPPFGRSGLNPGG